MLFVQTVNNRHLEKVKRKDQLHSILFNEDNLHKKNFFWSPCPKSGWERYARKVIWQITNKAKLIINQERRKWQRSMFELCNTDVAWCLQITPSFVVRTRFQWKDILKEGLLLKREEKRSVALGQRVCNWEGLEWNVKVTREQRWKKGKS